MLTDDEPAKLQRLAEEKILPLGTVANSLAENWRGSAGDWGGGGRESKTDVETLYPEMLETSSRPTDCENIK